jgi:cytochrome c biogenesis protein CcmG/thiol:disulfide interchange protein DsbE
MTETIKPAANTIHAPDSEEAPVARSVNWMSLAIWVGVISVLIVLGWGLLKTNEARPEGVAPAFEVQFFDGYDWQGRPGASLSDFRGQVVILNFWASWCVECRIEADLLEETWQAYRDKGVVFLGVAYIDVEPKSIAYMKEFGITYPNAPDLRSTISSDYQVTGVPETFFIDKEGNVAHITIGPVSEGELVGRIEQLRAAEG